MKVTLSYPFFIKSKESIVSRPIKKISSCKNASFCFLKIFVPLLLITSCSVSQQISNKAKQDFEGDQRDCRMDGRGESRWRQSRIIRLKSKNLSLISL
jgi:hypothetical protein